MSEPRPLVPFLVREIERYSRIAGGRPDKELFAAALRANMTETEQLVWEQLRDSKIGWPFYPQVLMSGYIADFWCPALRLIVELDGSQHNWRYDYRRDMVFKKKGITTIRVPLKTLTLDQEIVPKLVERFAQKRKENRI
jgi:very-short-patch-repair endonuclease